MPETVTHQLRQRKRVHVEDGELLRQTKFYPPQIIHGYVERTRLRETLDRALQFPLTLVSAPAGYGKSTVVSWWLKSLGSPSAWLSLENDDNDLRQFLSCAVFAVDSIFNGSVKQTKKLTHAATLPHVSTVVKILCNEIQRIDQDFVWVLDDIHFLENQSPVYVLLSELIRHPPRNLHLVLIGRRDPFLPLSSLRASGQLLEIRSNDLQLSSDETAMFLHRTVGRPVDKAVADLWANKTEGWVAGMRLGCLAMSSGGESLEKFSERMEGAQYVLSYLFDEVLSQQTEEFQRYLLIASICDRFCASLCEAMYERAEARFSGAQFIAELVGKNMFAIGLDTQGYWFRFHHLFQELLRQRLKQQYRSEQIAEFHLCASRWCESEGLIDEAIDHALASRQANLATQIIGRNMYAVLDRDEWYVLQRWLEKLPSEVKEDTPETLIAQCWIMYTRFRIGEMARLVERLQTLMAGKTMSREIAVELNHFLGILAYWGGQGKQSLAYLLTAKKRLSEEMRSTAADLEIYLGLARHMTGEKKTALRQLTWEIQSGISQDSMILSRQIATMAFIHLIDGELPATAQTGEQLAGLARRSDFTYTQLWSSALTGICSLQAMDLSAACHQFGVIAEQKYLFHTRMTIHCCVGMAIVYQMMHRSEEVESVMTELHQFAADSEDLYNMAIWESAKARLALLQGDLESAEDWLRNYHDEVNAPSMVFFLEIPAITACRVLIANGTDKCLEDAAGRLDRLWQATKAIHNIFQMIEISALRAFNFARMSQSKKAVKALEETLLLSKAGGWIRPYVELGAPMAELLQRLPNKSFARNYVRRILTAFDANDQRGSQAIAESHRAQAFGKNSGSFVAESLTNRELTILELLAQRLQNKEIAAKLFVSTETVKTHLQNIYQKLAVKNRRQAILRAQELGLIANN